MSEKSNLTAEKIIGFENVLISKVTLMCHEFYMYLILEEMSQIRCIWYFNYIGHGFRSTVVSIHSVFLPSPLYFVGFSDTNTV